MANLQVVMSAVLAMDGLSRGGWTVCIENNEGEKGGKDWYVYARLGVTERRYDGRGETLVEALKKWGEDRERNRDRFAGMKPPSAV